MSQKQQKRMWTGATFGAAVAAQRKKQAAAKFVKFAGTPTTTTQRLPYQSAPMSMRRVGNTEVKSFDVTVAAANVVAVSAVAGTEPGAAYTGLTEINCIAQGATVANRIGNKVVVKSVQICAEVSSGAAAAVAGLRAMLVYDKQPNGAFPAIADILLDQPAGTGMALSSINIANKSRFVFIRDQFFTIDPGVGQEYILKLYAKGRWETEYGSNAGNIGDIKTGALYMLLFYTRYGTAVPALSLFHSRIRYFD